MSPLLLRPATPADAAPLAAFAADSFTDTYRDLDDAQEIADYVAEHFRADVMTGVIADPACSTLLACDGDRLAGYAVVRDAAAPPCVAGAAPLQLWRLYLGRAFIGRGLGAALLQAAHDAAWRRGGRTLWLGVYDRNVRAVAFYERAGFARVGGRDFLFGGRVYVDPIYATPVRAPVRR